MPYRRTFDIVMWRCVQSGLTQKWVLDLNKLYWKEAQAAKSQEERNRDAEAAAAVRDDGLVSETLQNTKILDIHQHALKVE